MHSAVPLGALRKAGQVRKVNARDQDHEVRVLLTRWGWLIILIVAAAVFFIEPDDGALLASRILLGLGILAAVVSILLKRKASQA